ncbi:MAG: hypothetical protein EA422_04640 [Gemmatimonadales bacterium]|nr:MAG: hypothetical protein EA422_04640 [Gemmatimonadales bacterium]
MAEPASPSGPSIRRAHMATFPARSESLPRAVASLAPQVDQLHLVLNEYDGVPPWLSRYDNVIPVLPERDVKALGKFYPRPGPDDRVFLVDDDLIYAPDYCASLEAEAGRLGWEGRVFGVHGSILAQRRILFWTRRRRLFHYARSLRHSRYVDQLGTGTMLVRGRNLPSHHELTGGETMADARYARWCHEKGLDRVAVARRRGLIRTIRVEGPSIYSRHNAHLPQRLLDEQARFAGKSPRIGKRVEPGGGAHPPGLAPS